MFCDNVVCIILHHLFPDDVFKAAVPTPQCRYLVLSNAEIILTIVDITLQGAYNLPVHKTHSVYWKSKPET